MKLLTADLHASLLANHHAHLKAMASDKRSPDPVPVARFFNPVGQATWLASEIDPDGVFFGIADLGFGCPELGSFSREELEAMRLPFGMRIERDLHFRGAFPLSVYAEASRQSGSLVLAERLLLAADRRLRGCR